MPIEHRSPDAAPAGFGDLDPAAAQARAEA